MKLLSRRRRPAVTADRPSSSSDGDRARRAVLAAMRHELVPLKNVAAAIDALPPGSQVSVTCSPAKGLEATVELTARLLDLGHDAVPHLSARMVTGRDHVARLAAWVRDHGVREVFVVGGDGTVPAGPYADGAAFLRDLLDHDTGLRQVGVPAYPDGHPMIDVGALRAALRSKQELIAEAGVQATMTTQMCFDAGRVTSWLRDTRAEGITMPVVLGVPGVVDRARLMTMGVRLGIGASLRYLRKNRSTVTALLAPGGYDPTELVTSLVDQVEPLGLAGLHVFTFNAVADTVAWQRSLLAAAER